MNQRDAWDIISSTFNDDILETLNQLVAIHLEDSNHIVVDVRAFPINHLILLLKEISPADMLGQIMDGCWDARIPSFKKKKKKKTW